MKPLESMKNNAFSALKELSFSAVIMRIARLMERDNISVEKLCRSLGFNEKRFEEILGGKIHPCADEIVLLAGFFGVSTDYILKGDLS